jgi:pectin methylesterase-like acyl-CoA thioesterase
VNAWPTLVAAQPPADTDHDGMPDSWENGNGLNANNAADRSAIAANGYTNLENYLNSLTSINTAPVSQKQLIGIWPAMEGGFENQPAGTVSTATPTGAANLSPTVWTSNSTASIINNGTARTGSNYFTYTSTSTSTKNCFSPTVTAPLFVSGTKYIVQYYYRAVAPAAGNGVSGLLAATDNRGTVNFVTTYNTIPWTTTNGAWAKAAQSYSLNNSFTPSTVFAGFRFNGGGTAIAQPFDVDDFVVYPADNQASPAADVTEPGAVTASAATGKYGSVNLTWTAPATGVDGGGYIVIRSSSASQPALNPNGIYSLGNVVGAGTVVYIGANTGFTDDGHVAALVAGATYYYHIYTVDKAFNYSPAATASAGITANVVVSLNGGGNYSTIQAAINAAPTGRTTPYVIYIKNGRYVEKVNIPSNKPFIQLIGESAGNVIISWDSYAGKTENGIVLGTSNSATLTINAADCFMMNVTVENTTGYTGDGPQALALNVTADRCAFKNCRFIGGQDTVLAHGDGNRQYFLNCYIDGNTDFIFGSSIGVFDSCVIFPRDRVDGSSGGYITATNTSAAQAYGYVFRDCRITENRGVTTYTLGRPWQNSAGFVDKKSNKTVFLNAVMGASISPLGWSAWDTGTNTSLITYAEYKSRKFDGSLVDVSQRVSWSKQLTDAQAAPYFVNSNMFGTWNPLTAFPALGNQDADEVAVANFRAQRSATFTTLSWNLCWPMTGVLYEVYRSTDSINFTMIKQISGVSDNVVAYSYTDSLPAQGSVFYYYVKATRPGSVPNTSYVATVDPSIPLDGEFRSAASGFWTNASSGNGTNPVSIWEKYVAASKSWVLQANGVQPFNANVTIRTGHTVSLDGLKSVNNLFIESGAVLKGNGGYGATPAAQALRVGAGSAAGVIIKNDGVLGGDASPDDLILIEFNTACASVLWTGAGVSKINRVRPLPANPNPLKVVFDQDVNLSLNSGAFTAYYNGSANTTSEHVTFTINTGKTIKLVNPAGSFSPAGNTTPNPGGRYTYNIEGVLDLSATTTTSNLVPFSTNAASVISLNIGSAGVLKMGTGFNTVNSAPSTTGNNGKVVLTIANGGLVDATKTTNLTTGSNYFIIAGTGALKRAVGATAVSFPVGTSTDRYNPVTLTNTGTLDNFAVSVKNSFDNAVPDADKVVNKQWTITEEVAGGSNVTVKFGWVLADQAGGFSPSLSLAVMQYKNATWNMTAASLSGSGTLSSPYTATASGYTTLGAFGVASNTSGARVNVQPILPASGDFNETVGGYQVLIYPNPVRDNLNVFVNKLSAGATIQLYNVNGLLVRSLKLTAKVQHVSVKGLTSGMYYMHVRNGGQTITRKIAIQ